MKVTKYPQSCLLVEEAGKRIVIDPGSLVSASYAANNLLPLDAILITHEHQDHADPELIKALAAPAKIPVYANEGVRSALGQGIVTNVVQDGETFSVGSVKVVAYEVPHVDLPNGNPGPQNTGYMVADQLFHPGDSISVPENVDIYVAAVPLSGPDISPRDVFDFIKKTKCKVVVPIHYDYFPADPNMFKDMAKGIVSNVKFINLANGESADI